MIYKTLQRKLKIEHHEPHYKPEMNTNALQGKGSSLSTSGIRHATIVANTVICHE